MTWNYRVVVFDTHRALHEVYYDDVGRPISYTENPVTFAEELNEEPGIIDDLVLALACISKYEPLDAKVFELPVEERPICPRSME